MEEGLPRKKRGVSESPNLTDRPSKKTPKDMLDGPESNIVVSSWDEKTVRYQCKAMLNRLSASKLETGALTANLHEAEQKLFRFNEQLNISDHSWKILHENLRGILQRLKQNQVESLRPFESKKESKKGLISYLEAIIKSSQQEEREDLPSSEEVKKFLEERNNSVVSVLTSIVEAIEERDQINQNLCQSLKSTSTDEQVKNLLAENERLKSENNLVKQSNDELKAKYNESESRENKVQRAYNKLSDQIDKLKEDVLEARDQADQFRGKFIRTVNSWNEVQSEFESYKIKVASEKIESTTSVQQALPTIIKEGSSDELIEISQTLQARNETIARLEEQRTSMIKELEWHRNELNNLSFNRIASSRHFVQVDNTCKHLSAEIEQLRRENDALTNDLRMEQSRREDEKAMLISSQNSLMESKNNQLKTRDEDLIRYKRERDEARMKNRQLESSQFTRSAVMTLQVIADCRESECKKLRSEIAKYKEDSEKLKTIKEDTKKSQEKQLDLLEQRNYQLKEMDIKLRENEKTVINMKREKKEWEDREREFKMIIEVYQRDAKDKREIREIRVSEQRLKDENQRLQNLCEKFDRGVGTGGIVDSAGLLKEAEARIADLEEKRRELSNRFLKAEKMAKEAKIEEEKAKASLEAYSSELDEVTKAYDEAQETSRKLTSQLLEKEDNLSKFISESIRKENIHEIKSGETEALNERISTLESRISAQEEVLAKSENKSKLLSDQIKRLTEELRRKEDAFISASRVSKDKTYEASESKAMVDKLEKEIEELKSRIINKTSEADSATIKCNKIQDDLNRMIQRFERHKLGIKEEPQQTDTFWKDLSLSLKAKLKCSVCNDNERDCVITKCFHTFCRPCIKKKLDLRSRKCPSCNKPFAESDVHDIY